MTQTKFYPIIVMIFIVVVVFTGLSHIGSEITGNANLDNVSKTLIQNFNNDLDANFGDLTESNLTLNGSNSNQDAFTLQFLEGKQQAETKVTLVDKIKIIPDLMFLAIGVEEENLAIYKGLLAAFLLIIVSVATFVAFFGEGRIT